MIRRQALPALRSIPRQQRVGIVESLVGADTHRGQIARRVELTASGESDARGLVVVLDAPRPFPALDLVRLKRWLSMRLPGTVVEEVAVRKVAP